MDFEGVAADMKSKIPSSYGLQ